MQEPFRFIHKSPCKILISCPFKKNSSRERRERLSGGLTNIKMQEPFTFIHKSPCKILISCPFKKNSS